ncbi:hypothetical protein N657DRAFT_259737 [Parathielavia appendiculata]|uniref:Uncharacterized protein n=1 Tax=Parathielavia appendiculata TaxID=2587402 RepID=A0AAN6TRP8_9PEZI|nr:hypothetical protein N657DRAFT_259737 [Parathielavia appendiculata]
MPISPLQDRHDPGNPKGALGSRGLRSNRNQDTRIDTTSSSSAIRSESTQSSEANIASLVNAFSRFRPQDSGGAKAIMSHKGVLHAPGGSDFESGDEDVNSWPWSDKSQSPSADEETPSGTAPDHTRLDIIDRIMRSFCASLDNKIAVIKETRTDPIIKQEHETDPLEDDGDELKVHRTKTARKRFVMGRLSKKRSPEHLPLPSPPAAPVSNMPLVLRRPAATVPVLAAASPVATAPPMRLQASAPVPEPPSAPPNIVPVHRSPVGSRPFLRLGSPSPVPQPPPTAATSASAGNLFPPTALLVESSDSAAQPLAIFQAQETSGAVPRPADSEDVPDHSSARLVRRFGARVLSRGKIRDKSDNTATGEGVTVEPDNQASSRYRSAPQRRQTVHTRQRTDSELDDFSVPNSIPNPAGTESTLTLSHAPALDPALPPNILGDTQSGLLGSEPSLHHLLPSPSDAFYGQTLFRSAAHHAPRPAPPSHEALGEQAVTSKTKRVAESEGLRWVTLQAVLEDADGDGRRKKTKRAPPLAAVPGANVCGKFACPYFKRNPKKYRNWTSCPGPGWDEVHRVKTHLYRRHALPVQCPRCWDVFKSDAPLQSHLQQDPPCAIQGNRLLQEGFTKDQEKKLRSRKKSHADMTDEDKWFEIYKILFPDDDPSAIPSPYYNGFDSEGSSREVHGSGELEDYATFIRREMPTLVRRELETLFRDEFQDVEERIRPRIAEIVLNLQPRLLGLYKQSQIPLSEYGPQQHEHNGGNSSSEPTYTPLLSQPTDSATGTGPDSTPDTVFDTAELGFSDGDLNTNWDAFYPGNQTHMQAAETGSGLELNWEYEFNHLLNPLLFMPVPGHMQSGDSGRITTVQRG